jgi:hypothetical protein
MDEMYELNERMCKMAAMRGIIGMINMKWMRRKRGIRVMIRMLGG